ncbi:MAG: hypothetical protein ACR2P4_08250 [Gammaproteobacteria bacterium]
MAVVRPDSQGVALCYNIAPLQGFDNAPPLAAMDSRFCGNDGYCSPVARPRGLIRTAAAVVVVGVG